MQYIKNEYIDRNCLREQSIFGLNFGDEFVFNYRKRRPTFRIHTYDKQIYNSNTLHIQRDLSAFSCVSDRF